MDNLNIGNSAPDDHHKTLTEDVIIDIFSESMIEYLEKLDKASVGRYELDNYDMQVLEIAMEQFAACMK